MKDGSTISEKVKSESTFLQAIAPKSISIISSIMRGTILLSVSKAIALFQRPGRNTE